MSGAEDGWTEIYNEPFPARGDKLIGQLIRDEVAMIDVPEAIRDQGKYCVKVQIRAQSGTWKHGWSFEGFSVTKTD